MGAEESFVNAGAARQWGIPSQRIERPRAANSLNDQQIGSITHSTLTLKMLVSGNHQEIIQPYVIDSPHTPVILGHPWMTTHNPEIDWGRHVIHGWKSTCLLKCLNKAHSPVPTQQLKEIPDLTEFLSSTTT